MVMLVNKKRILCCSRVISDWTIIVLVHLVFYLSFRAEPRFSGFLCSDRSIGYPNHKNTISGAALVSYAYLLPVCSVVILELLTALYRFYVSKSKDAWQQMGRWMYNAITIYLIAVGITNLLTSLFKMNFGRLRPHFLDVCKPDVIVNNCTGFVSQYTCQGTDQKTIRNARLSFVSGHSSLTAVAVTYIVLYLQERLRLTIAPLLRPMLQTALVGFGFFVAISRFTDNKHHVADLIGGTLLGVGTALTLFLRYLPTMDEVTL